MTCRSRVIRAVPAAAISMAPAEPAIRLVRMPPILVRVGPDLVGLGADGSWADVPPADCGGRVVVGLWGAGRSVMAVLPSPVRAGQGNLAWHLAEWPGLVAAVGG